MTQNQVKQLVILSGKGGTGKTSISSAFAYECSHSRSDLKTVLVDADVDAANLGLVLEPQINEKEEFWGGSLAEIDPEICAGCGSCEPVCRYDAVFPDQINLGKYWIDPIACDGCAACVYACPEEAITMVQQQEGHWFKSQTPYGDFYHAELFPGKENSGKLVTLVKQKARLAADDQSADLVVIDGPPGIGCPVISACAGVDLGLVITEPGQAGIHDMQRVLGTLQHFKVPTVLCINKADLYPEGTEEIQRFAEEQGIEVVGYIPFDTSIPHAMLEGKPINALYPQSNAAAAIHLVWEKTMEKLLQKEEPDE
jgi:MinD superfamily P-loop ATPase